MIESSPPVGKSILLPMTNLEIDYHCFSGIVRFTESERMYPSSSIDELVEREAAGDKYKSPSRVKEPGFKWIGGRKIQRSYSCPLPLCAFTV
jgi:hypothetical protein